MSRQRHWRALLNEQGPISPATKKRKTKSQPRAKRRSSNNGGWLLSNWLIALRTLREHPWPRDRALAFINNQLQTGSYGTRPRLPLGWRLKIIGDDDSLFVVWRSGRLDARKVFVYEIILEPVPITPELLRAFSPEGDDAGPARSSASLLANLEPIRTRDWYNHALEAHSQYRDETTEAYAKRLFGLQQDAAVIRPWQQATFLRELRRRNKRLREQGQKPREQGAKGAKKAPRSTS